VNSDLIIVISREYRLSGRGPHGYADMNISMDIHEYYGYKYNGFFMDMNTDTPPISMNIHEYRRYLGGSLP
jgi:hypothetical protein